MKTITWIESDPERITIRRADHERILSRTEVVRIAPFYTRNEGLVTIDIELTTGRQLRVPAETPGLPAACDCWIRDWDQLYSDPFNRDLSTGKALTPFEAHRRQMWLMVLLVLGIVYTLFLCITFVNP